MVAAPPTGHSPAEPAGLTCRRRCDRRGGLRPPAAPAFRYRPRSRAGIQSPGVTRLTGPENGRRRWAVVECIVKVNLRLESAPAMGEKMPAIAWAFRSACWAVAVRCRIRVWSCWAWSGPGRRCRCHEHLTAVQAGGIAARADRLGQDESVFLCERLPAVTGARPTPTNGPCP